MLEFYGKYAKNEIYSQNGEEGLIKECLKRLKITTGHAVEAGGHNGKYLSNTALLADQGWTVKFVEADYSLWQQSVKNWEPNSKVKSVCSFVSPSNIDAFVDDKYVVLSLDTDAGDHAIWKALTARPAIVVIEIDSSIPPDKDEFNKDGGSGYKPMVELGISKGYFLLCHTGNLVFIDKKYRNLFPEIQGDGLKNSEKYFRTQWLRK
jgi:hypothetical protein